MVGVVKQNIAAINLVENCSQLRWEPTQSGMVDWLVSRVAEIRPLADIELRQVLQSQNIGRPIDVAVIGTKLLGQPTVELLREAGADLKTHHAGKPSCLELSTYLADDAAGLFRHTLLQLASRIRCTLGAPRHPKDIYLAWRCLWVEKVQVSCNHLL